MLAQSYNEFGKIIQSHPGRLSSTLGATVTPAQNAYGSYATVLAGASVTDDVYGISILVHEISVSGTATDSLTTIGLDPTGGTTFTDTINHLNTSAAISLTGAAALGCGVEYYFPLFIKAGTSIGAKGSINNATLGIQQVSVKLWCQPSRPELVKCGQYVVTLGATAATSNGTAVVPGTASEGTYTLLGSVPAGQPLWYWTAGVGRSSITFATELLAMDLAIGSSTTVNKGVLIDQIVAMNVNESITAKYDGVYAIGVPGDNVYMRLQNSSANTTNISGIAYGVGG